MRTFNVGRLVGASWLLLDNEIMGPSIRCSTLRGARHGLECITPISMKLKVNPAKCILVAPFPVFRFDLFS